MNIKVRTVFCTNTKFIHGIQRLVYLQTVQISKKAMYIFGISYFVNAYGYNVSLLTMQSWEDELMDLAAPAPTTPAILNWK